MLFTHEFVGWFLAEDIHCLTDLRDGTFSRSSHLRMLDLILRDMAAPGHLDRQRVRTADPAAAAAARRRRIPARAEGSDRYSFVASWPPPYCMPPSIMYMPPVQLMAASDARKSMSSATSSGCTKRLSRVAC